MAMARIDGVALASIGTDGIDGPTDAAGAIADGTTIPRAQALGLDASVALARHDSYPFLQALGDLVFTGPTGTNVGDLQVFLRASRHT
jgi:glycerate-2-kinase